MNLRVSVILVFALVLSACASHTRTETTSQPSAPVTTAPLPVRPVSAQAVPAPTPAAEATNLPTRVVTVEEIARVKHASAVAHPHDHPNFHRAAYLADPASYLSKVAGSRVYEVANPAADVASLTPAGPTGFSAPTNGEVTLAAKTEPGCPTTFVTFGLGEFPASGLQSVTVAADDQGVASTQFRIISGTVGNCLVLAGSPVCANTIQFMISVPESKP